MPKLGLTIEALNRLAVEIKNNLSSSALEEGLAHHTENRVMSLTAANAGFVLNGQVKENTGEIRTVMLDGEIFRLSRCDCGASTYCSHIAAVFLLAYSLENRDPVQFVKKKTPTRQAYIEEVKARRQAAESAAALESKLSAPSVELNFHQPASEKKSKTRSVAPAILDPSQPASEWHQIFMQRLPESSWDDKRNLHTVYQHAAAQFPALANRWEPLIRKLYLLYVDLYILNQLTRRLAAASQYDYYESFRLQDRMNETMDRIYEVVLKGGLDALFRKEPDRGSELKQWIYRHTFKQYAMSAEWLMIYRFCWGSLFKPEEAGEETKRLERDAKLFKPGSPAHSSVVLALVHFDILFGNDPAAVARLKAAGVRPALYDMTLYLNTFKSTRYWDRLLLWLNVLGTQGGVLMKEDVSSLFEYWTAGFEANRRNDEWRNWIAAHLVPLFDNYEAYLAERKQYKEWIDIHLCAGRFPDYYSWAILDEIKRRHPEWAIPLYHRMVDNSIARKNREGYRQASGLLKELKQLYSGVKRMPVWERYLKQLIESTSRLRAFHEELKKGHNLT